jgi:hypothetical protein
MSNIGRNDLCPCGSGKKYKKCCMLVHDVGFGRQPAVPGGVKRDDDFIPGGAVIDYGQPLLNEVFFTANDVHELSAPRFIYSYLFHPEIEGIANKVVRQFINRGKEERKRIKTAKNTETLIGIMRNNPDPLNHTPLIDRLIEERAQSTPMILQELKEPQNDSFVELAVRILHRSGTNCSKEIIDIIKSGNNRTAYAISILCVLLGFYDNEYAEKLLWEHYHYMKFKYPNDTYSDGPLLGLIEIRERRKEKASHNMVEKSDSAF